MGGLSLEKHHEFRDAIIQGNSTEFRKLIEEAEKPLFWKIPNPVAGLDDEEIAFFILLATGNNGQVTDIHDGHLAILSTLMQRANNRNIRLDYAGIFESVCKSKSIALVKHIITVQTVTRGYPMKKEMFWSLMMRGAVASRDKHMFECIYEYMEKDCAVADDYPSRLLAQASQIPKNDAIIESLKEKGAKPHGTLLIGIVKKNDKEQLIESIKEMGESATPEQLQPAFVEAVSLDLPDLVDVLIEHGANSLYRGLAVAAVRRNPTMARKLLDIIDKEGTKSDCELPMSFGAISF